MKKKICHISTVHRYNDDRILYKECFSLASAGYSVSLVIPHTKTETIEGVNIIPLAISKSRFYRLFILSFTSFFKALSTRASIFHFHDPELMSIGVLLKLLNKKVIYDVHEDLPKQILYKPWISSILLKKMLSFFIKYIEKFCCLFFDCIMPATPDIAKKFNPEKTIVIKNLAIVKLIESMPPVNIPLNKYTVIYVGGLSEVRGIKEVINALEILNGEVELWLLGPWSGNSYKNECETLAGYQYVKYFGSLPLEEVYPYIKKADVGLALLYPAKNYITSLPVKAFEYMACEKPMIMSDFKYWKEVFDGCAIFTNPMNSEEIAKAISKIKNDKELSNKLAKNGKNLIQQKFSWEKESEVLISAYNKLFSGN